MNRRRPLRPRARWPAVAAAALMLAAGLSPAAQARPGAQPALGPGARSSAASSAGRLSRATQGKPGPLTVVLTSMSPSTVPRTGPLRLVGTVTNSSGQVWQDINVHAFVSTTPITSPSALATAATLPYDADVGSRLQSPNAFVPIGDLSPGETARFRLKVPRSELLIPDRPGVYWVGAHALGANGDGRDGVADGRARTFIPLVHGTARRTSVALVVPFRETVRRDARAALRNPARWRRLLAPNGRLGRLLRIAESAGPAPLTLAVDPAVLDAVDTQAHGTPDPTAVTPSAGASTSADPAGTGDSNEADSSADPGAVTAQDWLSRFRSVASRDRLLGLGYADPDVAALARRSPTLLARAYTAAADTFAAQGVPADPAAVPADGSLPASALARLDRDTVVVLDDTAVPGRRSRWSTHTGQPLLVSDAQTAAGGPGPSATTGALAIRQRVVAAAALRALAGTPGPLVVSLPAGWDPGAGWQQADFFAAMDLPWLRLTGLNTARGAPTLDTIGYPADRVQAQIGPRLVSSARAAVSAAGVYADALTKPGGAAAAFTRLALEATSYHSRADVGTALEESRDLTRSIRAQLAGIRVVSSSFVAMTGSSGSFVVTLVNDLDRTVRVGLRARTSADSLTITSPRVIDLPPKQRTTVRLGVKASDIGVRRVRLTPVTRNGDPVGTPITVSFRSSQVSSLIWGVMGAGATLLVVMIVRRAVRRGLHREKTAG